MKIKKILADFQICISATLMSGIRKDSAVSVNKESINKSSSKSVFLSF